LRRAFFEDTSRRQMVAASVLDEDWLAVVAQSRGPYFFVAEGVLVYLPASITRPPRPMRSQLPARYRYLMPLADPVLGQALALTLFRASSPGAAG